MFLFNYQGSDNNVDTTKLCDSINYDDFLKTKILISNSGN